MRTDPNNESMYEALPRSPSGGLGASRFAGRVYLDFEIDRPLFPPALPGAAQHGARPSSRQRRSARRIVEGLLWLGAAVLGGIWLVAKLETRWVDRAHRLPPPATAESVTAAAAAGPAVGEPALDLPAAPPAVWPELANGAFVGRLVIPRLGVDAVILEGDGEDILSRAVGHLPDTRLPGDGGTVALAGHRDSFFQPLEHAQVGDRITLRTVYGDQHFEVAQTRVVEPTAVDILQDRGGEHLTLITCYPFRFVGSAPQRFIVDAVPIS